MATGLLEAYHLIPSASSDDIPFREMGFRRCKVNVMNSCPVGRADSCNLRLDPDGIHYEKISTFTGAPVFNKSG